jgi:hypothetical protein
MTQIQTHPDRQAMRDRAQALIASFDALPAPQTLTDMLRTARLLMALDRLLTHLWKAPADKTLSTRAAMTAGKAPDSETPPQPLNRQQRRALDARNKAGTEKTVRPVTRPVMPYATG